MATIAEAAPSRSPYAPDLYERFLALASIVLLACVLTALARGFAEWGRVPRGVWLHVVTITVALALTPIMLLRPRGTASHRQLGWIWVSAMFLTAFISLFVRLSNPNGFSVIHILSVITLVQVPLLVWRARNHDVKRHRRGIRILVTGALLLAGFFTFPFQRLLGAWLFS